MLSEESIVMMYNFKLLQTQLNMHKIEKMMVIPAPDTYKRYCNLNVEITYIFKLLRSTKDLFTIYKSIFPKSDTTVTCIFEQAFICSSCGIVFVTTTASKQALLILDMAGPEKIPCVNIA